MADDLFTPAIFKQRVPCTDCPFRKEGGVRHPPEMLASYIRYFTEEPGATFPCHKSVPASDDRSTWSAWQEGQVLCAGGLLFAAKLGEGNGIMREATARGWYAPSQHTAAEKALVFDSKAEMLTGPLLTFQCPKCKDVHRLPPPTLVQHRCERGACTYAALEAVKP